MIRSLDLGAVRLTLLLDAYGELNGNHIFYPATQDEWSPGLAPDPEGNLPIVVSALLISAGQQRTLVDTGYGEEEHLEREESVIKSLAECGVQPEDIDRVILTHSHGDHCLGNTLLRYGRWTPTFPLAEYVIQEREIIGIHYAGNALWRTRFEPLFERDQLRLIDSSTELSETLVCWPTPGHTVGHQSVLIRSDEARALYLGDLAVLARNMEHPEWGPAWAWWPEADVESRRIVAKWAVDNNAILIAGHDPDRAWIRLERGTEGYHALPVEQV